MAVAARSGTSSAPPGSGRQACSRGGTASSSGPQLCVSYMQRGMVSRLLAFLRFGSELLPQLPSPRTWHLRPQHRARLQPSSRWAIRAEPGPLAFPLRTSTDPAFSTVVNGLIPVRNPCFLSGLVSPPLIKPSRYSLRLS